MKSLLTVFITVIAFLTTFSNVASAQSPTGSLTVNKAIQLSSSAQDHYRSFKLGFNLKTNIPECSDTYFQFKGMDYKYFCSEFNTKKKLTKYLNETFTLNAIDKAYEKYNIIEHKGKLAYPANDDNSFLLWSTAKGKLIYQRNGVKQYEFTLKEETENRTEKRRITFVKVSDTWLINELGAAW